MTARRKMVSVQHVDKLFKLPHSQHSSIKSALIGIASRQKGYETQVVLKDINFDILEGEFFGIVGRNGSGKSTLLKLLAGIYTPNQGKIEVNGKLTPFIELGVGFNPELTGRENVFLNGALLGFNRKEMESMYDDIVGFAELDRFMDQKLKNYSSGMQVRLAFSIAIRAEGDILLLDEVLAVGDSTFQKKCYEYFKQLKKDHKTVILVSHDAGVLQEYCTRGLLLEKGDLVYQGPITEVLKHYADVLSRDSDQVKAGTEVEHVGTQAVSIASVKLGSARTVLNDAEPIKIDVSVKAKQSITRPITGITITDGSGLIIFQSNTLVDNAITDKMSSSQTITYEWSIPNVLNTGTYNVSSTIYDDTGTTILDWQQDVLKFTVNKTYKSHGLVNVEHTVKVI